MTGLFDRRPIRPMLCTTGEPFNSNEYIFEPKWDGLRTVLFVVDGHVELQNRNLRDTTNQYPELQGLSRNLDSSSAIIDGETVVIDKKGLPNFQRLQPRFGVDDEKQARILSTSTPVTFVAFDLLHLNGQDTINRPLEERKRNLKAIVEESPYLLYSDHISTHGERYYSLCRRKGFEGIVAKKRDSEYAPGIRSKAWIKVKGTQTVDCIILGYTTGTGARASTFGSLVLGAHTTTGNLVHLGNVGGGFSNQILSLLYKKLVQRVQKTPSIQSKVESNSPIVWVKPELVCEVEYSNVTDDDKLRFPRFRRLRSDVRPKDVRF